MQKSRQLGFSHLAFAMPGVAEAMAEYMQSVERAQHSLYANTLNYGGFPSEPAHLIEVDFHGLEARIAEHLTLESGHRRLALADFPSATRSRETATQNAERLGEFFRIARQAALAEGWSVSAASASIGLCPSQESLSRFQRFLARQPEMYAVRADYLGHGPRRLLTITARPAEGTGFWVLGCWVRGGLTFAEHITDATSATDAVARVYKLFAEERL